MTEQEKENLYQLQRIDCNCNDCWYMIRDADTFKKWKDHFIQLAYSTYETIKQRKLDQAAEWASKGEFKKAQALLIEAEKLKPAKPQQMIQYGSCYKFNKPVSFIPNTCQLETQKCFIHRKDLNNA